MREILHAYGPSYDYPSKGSTRVRHQSEVAKNSYLFMWKSQFSLFKFSTKLAFVGFLFTVPALIYFIWWVFIPIFYGLGLSFTQDTLLSPPKFNGLQNYVFLFKNLQFWGAVWITFLYGLEVVIPTLVVAFVIAWLISKVKRGHSFFLSAVYIPFVVPTVATAVIFELFMQPYGLLNQVLHTQLGWFTNPRVALIAVSIVTIWSLVGYYVIIFLAGLQQVSSDLVDAASIDGASSINQLRHVILPMIRPTLLFASVTCFAQILVNFTQPFVLTQGGPGTATMTVPLLIYKMAFQYSEAGKGSALAVVMLIVSLILTWMQFRLLREK